VIPPQNTDTRTTKQNNPFGWLFHSGRHPVKPTDRRTLAASSGNQK
jgi:hypothetical protein